MVAKMWYLKKIDLLSRLSDESMQKINAMTRMDSVKAGQPIYFPGDESNTIYLLKKGQVQIRRLTPEAERVTLTLLEPGEIFGGLTRSADESRRTMAETTQESFICAASREQFQEFLAEEPSLAFEVTKMMADRRRDIETKIENLLFKSASQRVAYVLWDLVENHSDWSGQPDNVQLPFSHQEIAELTGLTRPTVTNQLNQLADEELLELARQNITVTRPFKIKSRASNK